MDSDGMGLRLVRTPTAAEPVFGGGAGLCLGADVETDGGYTPVRAPAARFLAARAREAPIRVGACRVDPPGERKDPFAGPGSCVEPSHGCQPAGRWGPDFIGEHSI